MLPTSMRVPISINDLYGGFASADGLLILEGEMLLLEFQVKDEIFGMVKGKPKAWKIPLSSLDSMEYKQNWFTTKLIIRVQRLRDLEGVPGVEKGQLKLKISRRDRDRAKDLQSRAMYLLSEIRLREME